MANKIESRSKKILMEDVARVAGVSKTTVSRVLNGASEQIPEDTQKRVIETAKNMGYTRNTLASSLRRQQSDTIGFISDVIASSPNAGAMILGAQDAAWRAGKVLLLTNTGGNQEVEKTVIQKMIERQVDGLIYATMYHQVLSPPIELKSVPTVLLDVRSKSGSFSSVAPDEVSGASAATKHLIDLGHQKIGFLNSSARIPAAVERFTGFKQTLSKHGIKLEKRYLAEDLDEFSGGLNSAMKILNQANPPTALFCFNDRMAAGAIRAAQQLGLTVPDDLSIVGFDNQELVALLTNPPLTTFQLPHYEMGQWAVQHLLKMISEPREQHEVQMRIPFKLVKRDSTKLVSGK